MKPRKPMRRVSKHRARINRQRAKMLDENFGPQEERRCWFRDHPQAMAVAGYCHGEVHGHEVLKRSRAGSTDENLLNPLGIRMLCDGHNSWVEDWPVEAHDLGLARHAWEQ